MRFSVLVLCLASYALGQKLPSDVASVQLPASHKASGVVAADVDGDDLLDLVITAVKRGEETKRFMRVYLRRPQGGFAVEPDYQIDLHKEFTAFLIADVLPKNPGKEIVLLSGARAVAWLKEKTGRAQWVSLFRCKFILQRSRSGRILHMPDLAEDLDGDGLVDFLIPQHQSYGVFLQNSQGRFDHQVDLVLPPANTAATAKKSGSVRLSRRSVTVSLKLPEFEKARTGKTLRRRLVDSTEWAWRPRLVDFDGDGRKDLLVRGSHEVFLWLNLTSKSEETPNDRYDVPVVADRSRLVDIAYSSHFLDLNGDKKTDSVMIAGDQRSDKPRTQILVFQQGSATTTKASPLFGDKGIPSQLIVLAGFTGATDFFDVNGDGRLDLIIGSLRQDIIDKLRESSREKTEVELYVYYNQGGSFSRAPDIRQTFEMKLEGLRALSSGFLAKFIPDVTGDGIGELVTRTRPDRIDVHYFRKSRDGSLSMFKTPLWSFKLNRKADLFVLQPTAKEKPGILVVDSNLVTIVRF